MKRFKIICIKCGNEAEIEAYDNYDGQDNYVGTDYYASCTNKSRIYSIQPERIKE